MASMTPTARSLRDAGRELRGMRVAEGLSPRELGYLAGVSGRTIDRIENGARPRVRTAFLLASYFGFAVEDLWPL
jgi:DNA-binding XRE family transcriptional regulator